jgi:hypothetical protein
MCDYCRDRNRLDLNDLELSAIEGQIIKFLSHGPQLPAAIIASMPAMNAEKLTEILRWMLDNETAGMDALGRYYVLSG